MLDVFDCLIDSLITCESVAIDLLLSDRVWKNEEDGALKIKDGRMYTYEFR